MSISTLHPWFILADEMGEADTGLKVLKCREVLVVRGWGDVVREAQAIVGVLEIHI